MESAQSPVVLTLESAIHRINHALSSGWCNWFPQYLSAGKWFIRWISLSKVWATSDRTTVSDVTLLPAIFLQNDLKSRLPFTFQPDLPEFFVNSKLWCNHCFMHFCRWYEMIATLRNFMIPTISRAAQQQLWRILSTILTLNGPRREREFTTDFFTVPSTSYI